MSFVAKSKNPAVNVSILLTITGFPNVTVVPPVLSTSNQSKVTLAFELDILCAFPKTKNTALLLFVKVPFIAKFPPRYKSPEVAFRAKVVLAFTVILPGTPLAPPKVKVPL